MQWISYDAICLAITRPWRCHAKETLSSLLALCEGNPSMVDSPHKRPVINVALIISLNKLLNKRWQSSFQWFEILWYGPTALSRYHGVPLNNCHLYSFLKILRKMQISAWIKVTVQRCSEVLISYVHNVIYFICMSKKIYDKTLFLWWFLSKFH